MKQNVASSIENSTEAQPKMEAENGIRHSPASSAKSTQKPLFSHCYAAVAYARSLRKRCRRHCWQAIVPSDKAASLKYFEQKNRNQEKP